MLWTCLLYAVVAVFLAATRRKQGRGWRLARPAAVIGTALLIAVFELPRDLDLLGAAVVLVLPVFARALRPPPLQRALLIAAFLIGAFVTAPHWPLPL